MYEVKISMLSINCCDTVLCQIMEIITLNMICMNEK